MFIMKPLTVFSMGAYRRSLCFLLTLALDGVPKTIKMKQLPSIMAFVALLFMSISPIVAHEGPLLTMTSVKYSCVNINGQFKPVLYVTLDNLSFSFFGTTVEYEITGGTYTTTTPLKLNVSNGTMTANPNSFQTPVLTSGVTYTINSKAPGVGGNNTLTFVPTTSLCSGVAIANTSTPINLYDCPSLLNLVTNGQFVYGNDGTFASDLPLGCNSCTSSSYCVGSQFTNKCSTWPANTFDHTVGTASGNYLLVDGNPNQSSTVWYTQVSVCKGVKYTFSFWAKSIYTEAFQLGIMINNTSVPVLSTSPISQSWQQYTVNWTATTTGAIQIGIKQLTAGHKRDFGIDDIFFGYCCDCNKSPLNSMNFYLNGTTKIELADFQETDKTVKVIVDADTCYIFETETNLLAWTNKEEGSEKLMSFKNEIKTKTNAINAFLKEAAAKGILDNDVEMQKLFDKALGSQEQQAPSSRGLALLYEHTNFNGANIAVGRYPKMPAGWDNRVSSAIVTGPTMLCDYKNFGGSKAWLIPGTYPNLNPWNFNDRTSSVF
jgi:Beta/Gamma crystallin